MWVSAVKAWARALIIASLIEAALLGAFISTTRVENPASFISQLLTRYHLFAIWFSCNVLLVWNPGPRPGATPASNAVAWVGMFVFQLLVTTPIIYVLLSWGSQIHGKEKSLGR